MKSIRDLAQDDPWRQSAKRSAARRTSSRRSSVEQQQRTRETPKSRRAPALGGTHIVALFAAAAIVSMALAGPASQLWPTPARADPSSPGVGHANPDELVFASGRGGAPSPCPMMARATGYVNPLGGAAVKPERIDMGVDYAGWGTLGAIGAARVTYVGTENTGWPGAFVGYQLLDGPDAGCYVYYAEGVTPVPGLQVGDMVVAGQVLATIIPQYPNGFEIGWGAGVSTKTYATVTGGWSSEDDQNDVASGPGRSFSALVASLDGPPGKVEGSRPPGDGPAAGVP